MSRDSINGIGFQFLWYGPKYDGHIVMEVVREIERLSHLRACLGSYWKSSQSTRRIVKPRDLLHMYELVRWLAAKSPEVAAQVLCNKVL